MSSSTTGCPDQANDQTADRRWESPEVVYIGRLHEILQGGGGKLSTPGGDPGEARKVPGGEI